MLIDALNQYYDVLLKKDKLPPLGYEWFNISYLIALTSGGKLDRIIDIRTEKEVKRKNGKVKITYEPKTFLFPKRNGYRGIKTNYVETRGNYIFGLEFKTEGEDLTTEAKGSTEKQKAQLIRKHYDFVNEVVDDFRTISSPIAKAYYAFAQTWRPKEETQNPELIKLGKDLNTANFAFCLTNDVDTMLQDEKEVKDYWEVLQKKIEKEENLTIGQCAITGKTTSIARLHHVIKVGKGVGVRGTGNNPTLINFNWGACESYGHVQGQNACVSQEVMLRYTQTLNWLLSNPEHHCYLNDLTLAYWSQSGNDDCDNFLSKLFNQLNDDTEWFDTTMTSLMENLKQGTITKEELSEFKSNINPNTQYYIVGFAPNSARIQVKFFYHQTFGKLLENVAQHQEDMRLGFNSKPVPLWQLKKELTSPKTNRPEAIDVPFASIYKSIILGLPYPEWCYRTMLQRIRIDQNTEDKAYVKINRKRVGLIKAYLIRKTKEDLPVTLDKDYENPAYLCGRLFAELEIVQRSAAKPKKLNRTIQTAYFNAACTRPASIFPRLFKLHQHHMVKLRKKQPKWADQCSSTINWITGKLGNQFPTVLNLDEQGRFILGYFQQKGGNFPKTTENTEDGETKELN